MKKESGKLPKSNHSKVKCRLQSTLILDIRLKLFKKNIFNFRVLKTWSLNKMPTQELNVWFKDKNIPIKSRRDERRIRCFLGSLIFALILLNYFRYPLHLLKNIYILFNAIYITERLEGKIHYWFSLHVLVTAGGDFP